MGEVERGLNLAAALEGVTAFCLCQHGAIRIEDGHWLALVLGGWAGYD